MQTAAGDFDVVLDCKTAPEATAYFLKVTLDRGYHSGQFDRVRRDKTEVGTGTLTARVQPNWLEDSAKRLGDSRFDSEARRGYHRSGSQVEAASFVLFLGKPPEPAGAVVPMGKVVSGPSGTSQNPRGAGRRREVENPHRDPPRDSS